MKITKSQLKKLINEELGKINEEDPPEPSGLAGSIHGDILDFIGYESIDQAVQDGTVAAALGEVREMFFGKEAQSARIDIQDAIQMLESEEDTTGTLFHIINRLGAALEKLG